VFEYAPGSVLFKLGKTQVLCAVSIQAQVPQFLRGKGEGWLSAEYALLPMSTETRTQRESVQGSRNGRSVEISRFIGRVLRTVVDLSRISERTITVDCDVLHADGGTRVAAITGACLALAMAQNRWLQDGTISMPILKEFLCGVSVGVSNDKVLLDPDYREDMSLSADFNFVITQRGDLVEILGGAERTSVSWEKFEQIRQIALQGAQQLIQESLRSFDEVCGNSIASSFSEQNQNQKQRQPLFSLQNRIQK
jgi:ribonuclease PH